MKRKYIIMISLIIPLLAYASNDDILRTREELGTFFNESAQTVKKGMHDTDSELESDKESIKEIKRKAELFRLRSTNPEVNPTLLKQGKEKIPDCDYETQDLVWLDNKWQCKKASYGQDCDPTYDEVAKGPDGKKICKHKGHYEYKSSTKDGWSMCNYKIPCKQELVYKCMYVDSKGKELYQVPDSNCGKKPKKVTRNCCGVWKTTPWGKCIYKSPPNIGEQTRTVSCSKKHCDMNTKPKTVNRCTIPYGYWDVKGWEYAGYKFYSGNLCAHLIYKRSVSCSTAICRGRRPGNSVSCYVTSHCRKEDCSCAYPGRGRSTGPRRRIPAGVVNSKPSSRCLKTARRRGYNV